MIRIFGRNIFSVETSTMRQPQPEGGSSGGGGSNMVPNISTNHDIGGGSGIHHPFISTTHHEVVEDSGTRISQPISNDNRHVHIHEELMMNNINNDPNPTRRRERSLSSSASTTTMSCTDPPSPKKPKKERRPRPSKEEVSKATATVPRELPSEIRAKMIRLGTDLDNEESKPKLVIQKYVYHSDVADQQARLLIPIRQLITSDDEFLEEKERKVLNDGEGEIKVKVIQRSEAVADREMSLSRWPKPEMKEGRGGRKTSVRYAVQSGWKEVKVESNIKERDALQVWAFRYGPEKKLGLALVNLGVQQ